MRIFPTAAVALALLVAGSVIAQSGSTPPVFKLKGDEPTGSHLKRNAATGRLPFDKTYAQLTDEQKAMVRASYESMGPDDEPPYPKRGPKRLFQAVGEIQRKIHIEGEFDAGVVVGPDGKAQEVRIYQSASPEMTQFLGNLLVIEDYKPALCQGRPCTQEFPFRVKLNYEHR